jgi:hypothetical protein
LRIRMQWLEPGFDEICEGMIEDTQAHGRECGQICIAGAMRFWWIGACFLLSVRL